jgi:RhoGEF domain
MQVICNTYWPGDGNPSSLPLQVGQQLIVSSADAESGWSWGTELLSNRTGYFPSAFVSSMAAPPPLNRASKPADYQPAHSSSSSYVPLKAARSAPPPPKNANRNANENEIENENENEEIKLVPKRSAPPPPDQQPRACTAPVPNHGYTGQPPVQNVQGQFGNAGQHLDHEHQFGATSYRDGDMRGRGLDVDRQLRFGGGSGRISSASAPVLSVAVQPPSKYCVDEQQRQLAPSGHAGQRFEHQLRPPSGAVVVAQATSLRPASGAIAASLTPLRPPSGASPVADLSPPPSEPAPVVKVEEQYGDIEEEQAIVEVARTEEVLEAERKDEELIGPARRAPSVSVPEQTEEQEVVEEELIESARRSPEQRKQEEQDSIEEEVRVLKVAPRPPTRLPPEASQGAALPAGPKETIVPQHRATTDDQLAPMRTRAPRRVFGKPSSNAAAVVPPSRPSKGPPSAPAFSIDDKESDGDNEDSDDENVDPEQLMGAAPPPPPGRRHVATSTASSSDASANEPVALNQEYKVDDDDDDDDDDEAEEDDGVAAVVDVAEERRLRRDEKEAAKAAKDGGKLEATRRAVLAELVATEKSYCAKLMMVKREYELPLREQVDKQKRHTLKKLRPVCKERDLSVLFDAVNDMLLASEETLRQLEPLVAAYLSGASDVCMVGDVFVSLKSTYRAYSTYCVAFAEAMDLVERLSRDTKLGQQSKFARFLDDARQRCAGQSIDSLMITAIQRVPRLVLLLRELIKHTREGAELESLREGRRAMKEIGKAINEYKRAEEDHQTLLELEKCFDPPVPIARRGRRLLRAAAIHRLSGRERIVPCYVHVFSDQMVVSKQHGERDFEAELVWSYAKIKLLHPTDQASWGLQPDVYRVLCNAFYVQTPYEVGVFFLKSKRERNDWVRVLDETMTIRFSLKPPPCN